MFYFFKFFVVFFLFAFFAWVFVYFQRARVKRLENYVVLSLRVAKENEIKPVAFEHVFSALHGIQFKFSFFQILGGFSTANISFEVAFIGGLVNFYAVCPPAIKNLVRAQISAHYPDVEVLEVDDYSKTPENSKNAVGLELKLFKSDLFPIKRYSQFDRGDLGLSFDPLAGIVSALYRCNDFEDQAWVQIVSTPSCFRIRRLLLKLVCAFKNTSFNNFSFFSAFYIRFLITRVLWKKFLLFPFYFIFSIFVLFRGFALRDFESRAYNSNLDEIVSFRHDKEGVMEAVLDKLSRLLFEVDIRIVYLPKIKNDEVARLKLREISASFKQFNFSYLNGFEIARVLSGEKALFRYFHRIVNGGMILNNEELAGVFHLPNVFVNTPVINWLTQRKFDPPVDLPVCDVSGGGLIVLGQTDCGSRRVRFGIEQEDRRRHFYIIGKTGTGKSTVLLNMIYSDIMNGRGVGLVDPHGDLADEVLRFIPSKRINDVVLIDPSDGDFPVAFNLFEDSDISTQSIVCSGLMEIFKKIYGNSWGPRLEYILRNTFLALLQYPGSSLLGVSRMLQDFNFRTRVVNSINDPVVKSFWVHEFENMTDRMRAEAISPILNKVGQFLSCHVIRNIVGQSKSSINFRFFMDTGKIIIINLAKGKIGEDNCSLLGSMFVTKFQIDAMSRANVDLHDRRDFYLYVDEFQNFATDSFSLILSEARKYGLNLIMSNQYIAQLNEDVKNAIFGNVGSILSFQLGFDDAEYISRQYGGEVTPEDLVSLSKYRAYLRLLIRGNPSKVFSLETLPFLGTHKDFACFEKIRKVSRERYSNSRLVVEDKIRFWNMTNSEKKCKGLLCKN